MKSRDNGLAKETKNSVTGYLFNRENTDITSNLNYSIWKMVDFQCTIKQKTNKILK